MATFTDTIRFVVEAVTGNAESKLKGLQGDLAKAETAGGKLKAGIGSVGTALKDNLGLGLAGAGAAVTAFVGKAIGEFQDLALNADKMAEATGLAVEDASRWNEVAGDLGVNVDAVAGGLNRLNRAAAEGKLHAVGIDADNANDRFIETLQLLQGITDEAERARLGQELLGKSWTELAPLIQSAKDLRGALADVSDEKVIDEEEVAKAKRYRDAMDELNGVLEDLTLSIGEAVIPALSGIAETVADVSSAVENLTNAPGFKQLISIADRLGFFTSITDLPGEFRKNLNSLLGRETEPQTSARDLPGFVGPAPTVRPASAPYIGTQIINPPPGYRGDEVDAAQRNFWQSNGRVTWSGQ